MNAGYEASSDEAWKYWVKNGLYTELKNHLKNEEDIGQFLEKVRLLLPENARGDMDDLRKLVQKVDTNTKKDDRLLVKARVVADNFPLHIDTLERMFPQVDVLQFRRVSRSSIPTTFDVPSEPAGPRAPESLPKATIEHIPSTPQSVPNITRAPVHAEAVSAHCISSQDRDISHSSERSTLDASGFLGRIGYFGAAIGAAVAAPFALMGGFLVGYFYLLDKAYNTFLKPFFEGKKKEGHSNKKEKRHEDHHGKDHGHGAVGHGHH